MKKIILLLFIALLMLATACVSDQDFSTPNLSCNEPAIIANKSVEMIKEKATALPALYEGDDVIEGYVTSSDKGGNFYKTISFQTDAKIGFSVPVDDTNLYVNFEPGRKVYLQLKNNYFDLNYNSLRIGSLYVYPSSRTATIGRLSVFEYKKILLRSCQVVSEEFLVQKLTLENINDSHLNTLVEFNQVQFTQDALGNHLYEITKDTGGATNHLITDESGKKLIVRTSSFASFKEELVPENSGAIKGVLTKYGNDYQLMPRYFSDIQMTEPRF